MRLVVAFALGALLAALPACRMSVAFYSGTGTLFVGSGECGAWFIRADSGHQYQLTRLPTEFQHSDLRVRFTLKKRSDLTGAGAAGEVADVVSMTRL